MKEWDEVYTADESIKSSVLSDEQVGMLETYGDDIALVRNIDGSSPNRLWTVVDGDDGELYVVAGYHFVNRVHYMVSVESWKSDDEEYLY